MAFFMVRIRTSVYPDAKSFEAVPPSQVMPVLRKLENNAFKAFDAKFTKWQSEFGVFAADPNSVAVLVYDGFLKDDLKSLRQDQLTLSPLDPAAWIPVGPKHVGDRSISYGTAPVPETVTEQVQGIDGEPTTARGFVWITLESREMK